MKFSFIVTTRCLSVETTQLKLYVQIMHLFIVFLSQISAIYFHLNILTIIQNQMIIRPLLVNFCMSSIMSLHWIALSKQNKTVQLLNAFGFNQCTTLLLFKSMHRLIICNKSETASVLFKIILHLFKIEQIIQVMFHNLKTQEGQYLHTLQVINCQNNIANILTFSLLMNDDKIGSLELQKQMSFKRKIEFY